MADLNKFIEWSKNNPGCKVKIEIGGYRENETGRVEIWVYDSGLGTGQFVSSVDEIDVESEYKRKMEQKKREVEEYFQKEGVV
ncbi:MAG: hypothetical protein QM295_03165 [Bacillota bacterium]|mgnify:CR=1 FL=1|nr:hypothetical protein [Bacillota bacterium]